MNNCKENNITVAVLTYRRQELLTRCLEALVKQETYGKFEFSILVVDNDRDESAKETVEFFSDSSEIKIKYICEKKKNIATARNRAIKETDDPILAFIDDDEYADKEWLSILFEYYNKNSVDLVNGPVHLANDEIEDLYTKSYYRGLGYKDGERDYDVMCTNNCLFNLSKAKTLGIEFREDFGLSGGEDQVFFEEYIEKGALRVWAAKAKVFENFPEQRRSFAWQTKRHFRYGNSHMRMLKMKKSRKEVFLFFIFRLRLLLRETFFYCFYATFPQFFKTKSRDYLFSIFFSWGVIAAYFGHISYEYK